MKLNFKIYSPFFILLFLALSVSCKKEPNTVNGKKVVNKEAYLKIMHEDTLARKNYEANNYEAAYKQFMNLSDEYLTQNDTSGAGYAQLMAAHIQWSQGDYIGTEATAVKALDLLKKSGKNDYLNSAYLLLGIVNRKAFDYENAITNYKEAMRYSSDSSGVNVTRNNIASIYTDNKQYDKALKLLLQISKSKYFDRDTITKARVLDNIGAVYFKLKRPEALSFLQKGLELRKENGDKDGLTASYLNLYDFYINNNKPLAFSYALKAYNTSSEIKNSDDKLKALKALVNTSGDNRDKYINAFFKLDDSLDIAKSKTEVRFANLRYNVKDERAKRKADQIQTKLQDEKDRFDKLLLGMGMILLFVIGAFTIFVLKARHKKAKVREVYNTESRISKKIHDELANDVFNVMSYAESQGLSNPEQEKLVRDLDVIYQKTRDISRENNAIDTGENFAPTLLGMLADYKTDVVNVMTINFETVPWNEIADHKKITIYRVLQELMVNMKKHSRADIVAIKFTHENKKIIISYNDNGKGLDSEKLIYKNGLQNAGNRISAIDGTLTFENSISGLKVNCTFPV